MKTSAVQNASQINQNTNVKVLKNGSQVLVRVLAENGNGKYEGSVAGVKVSFTAKNPLSVGQTFVATVNQKNGILELLPKENPLSVFSDSILNTVSDNQISKYLSSLGLIPDNLSFHLLKQLKQNKAELNPSVLNKIHNRAAKFPGQEKNASEIILMLLQKGIELDDDELKKFLEDYEASQKDEIFEKINEKKSSWKLLPFQIVDKSEIIYGKGIIRILKNKDFVEKLNLNCNYNSQDFIFLIDFKGNKPEKIFFYSSKIDKSENQLKCDEINKIKKMFSKINPEIKVEFSDKDILSGFGCETEQIYILDGEV